MRRSLYDFMNIKPTIRITWLESPTHTTASVTMEDNILGKHEFMCIFPKPPIAKNGKLWNGIERKIILLFFTLSDWNMNQRLRIQQYICNDCSHTSEWLTNTQFKNRIKPVFLTCWWFRHEKGYSNVRHSFVAVLNNCELKLEFLCIKNSNTFT